jgi:hypothetical protein
MKIKLILCLALVAFNLSSHARVTRLWSGAELLEASDLVVVGQSIKVKDLDEMNSALWPGGTKLRGVEATFAVSKVLKGDFTNRTVVLHYYRWDTPFKTSDSGSAFGPDVDSPGLIYLTPSNTNQFLLYLVSDGATRYAPASGQLDTAADAVREILQPKTIHFKAVDEATGRPLAGVNTSWKQDSNDFSSVQFGHDSTNLPPSMEDGEIEVDGLYEDQINRFIFSRNGYATVYGTSEIGGDDLIRSDHTNSYSDWSGFILEEPLTSVKPSNGFIVVQMHDENEPPKLKVVRVDSEETNSEDGCGKNAVDGNLNTYWHTEWHRHWPGLPHEIVIELLPPSVIKGFTYLPRQDESDHGTIKDYEFYVSNDGRNFGQPVSKGAFGPGKEEKMETFKPIKCRFIKLKAISEINGLPWTSAAEIGVIQSGENTDLTKQISDILAGCQKIKPGMTRAELLKIFTTEGGLSTATHRTYVYRGCPYIKVDVEFTPSEPGQNVLEERPGDIISKVSKPYLDWSIID